MQRRIACVLLLILALPLSMRAQNSTLEFEVASVKPNKSGSGSAIGGLVQGDRFTSTNVTLMQLVRTAYGVQEFQVSGQPGWFGSERFDIEAKMPAGSKPGDWQAMLQSLLAVRFKLALHRANRDVAMYALVVGRNGPKLTPADPNKCDRSKQPSGDCGFRASPSEIVGTSVTMSDFATRLSRSVGRMVIDRTDLKGEFDFKLEWTADPSVPLPPGASASPAIFAGIQDQLGLRLESTKGPVETLVIDRVERPSDN